MAFNVGNFIKGAAKPIVDRLLDDVISQTSRGLPMNVTSSAKSISESLFNAGSSFESISSLTSQKTDAIVNQGPDIFYALAGKDPARASAADLRRLRNINSDSTEHYINNINPSSAIEAKRRRDNEIIISAVS